NIPAGDLGTHLPRLTQDNAHPERRSERPKPAVEQHKTPPPPTAPDNDKTVIALNTGYTPTPTPTPEPPPEPTAEPTEEPTPEPTPEPTLAPTPKPTRAPTPKPRHRPTPRPTARPTPAPRHRRPLPTPAPVPRRSARPRPKPNEVVIARAAPTPSVKEQLAALRESLLKEHLEERAAAAKARASGPSGGGPVVANVPREGEGYGVGAGKGSMGIQQDPQFLLYYQTVQDRIKKAWNYVGGSGDLTTSVTFAIGPDGSLTGVKLTQSSRDPAFDDSVLRAIRRAAPFPPPPEKYRPEFGQGVDADFKLGELKS
ncbi:MAG TPA: TonB family protein, partial [Candidatus Binataceae bacterium]|nr:TonB family protein [Candidatus Binataceae bacterium]